MLSAASLIPTARGSTEPTAVTTEVTRDTPITAEHVNEVVKHLGLSPEDAELKLRLERASIGFEAELIAAFPEIFAGAWLAAEGPPGLTVALADDTDAALAQIQKMFAFPDRVSVVKVRYSFAQLLALQEAMIQDRTRLQSDGAGPLAVTRGIYDLDIDVQRNTVVVRLPELTDELRKLFTDAYGSDMVVVEGNASMPEACTATDCRYTLRGGLRTDNYLSCSTAFSAKTPNNYYVLSAAHCYGGDNTPRYHAGERYGTVTHEVKAGRVDAERHYRPYPSPWGTSWYISASVLVDGAEFRPIRHHISWDSTMINTYVGKSGYASGTTRGHIFSKTMSPSQVQNSERFIGADYCANGGDSGGAVFNTNTAYGIHHGGPSVNGVGLECGDPGDYGIFGNVVYAADAMQVQILAAP